MTFFIILFLLVVIVTAIPVFVAITNNAKIIFWTTLLFIFLPIGYINRYFISFSLLRWVPFGVVIICFTAILLRQLFTGKFSVPYQITLYFIFVLLFSFISLLFNKTSAEPAFFSGVGFLSYFFLATIFNYKTYELTTFRLFKYLLAFGIINIGVALFQRIFLVILLHRSSDMVAGLFTSDGQFTIYQLFCLIVVVVYTFYDIRIFSRIGNYTLAIFLIVSLGVSGNVAFIFFLPLAFFGIFLFVNKKKFFQKFRALFAIFILVIAIIFVYSLLYQSENESKKSSQDNDLFTMLSNPEYIQQNFFGSQTSRNTIFEKDGSLRRGSSVTYTYGLVSKTIGSLILGKGPGSTSEATLPGAEGSLDKKYKGLNLSKTTYSFMIAEMGLGGIFIMICFLFFIFFWKSKTDASAAESIIRKSFVVVLIVYFGYENVFNDIEMALIFASLTMR